MKSEYKFLLLACFLVALNTILGKVKVISTHEAIMHSNILGAFFGAVLADLFFSKYEATTKLVYVVYVVCAAIGAFLGDLIAKAIF